MQLNKVLQYKQMMNEVMSTYQIEADANTIKNTTQQLLAQSPNDYKEISAACFQKTTEFYINQLKEFILFNNLHEATESIKKYTEQLINQSPQQYKEINYAYLQVKYELIGQPLNTVIK
ncbi:hypothetical protein H9635_00070 [Solibacillus sp. A46]|uniref:Uncharacterized protein n=1 Tax=Solibacillus faecavium TaxID=2762221 RepID=A0ABR8XT74_9BACL|nr:hypothetical protein [Solibacillus faecavium]MBD8035111.1 hypothetical protein [Solibacillus faecavium]